MSSEDGNLKKKIVKKIAIQIKQRGIKLKFLQALLYEDTTLE